MCVLCVCVGWWSFFTSSVSLHFLSIHCHHQLVTTLFSFLAGAVLVKKVSSFSIHPSTSHPFYSNPVVILSFSLYVLNLWTDWNLWNSLSFCFTITGLETVIGLLGDFLSSLFYNYWIGDLHWISWGLFNYRDYVIINFSFQFFLYSFSLQFFCFIFCYLKNIFTSTESYFKFILLLLLFKSFL